MTDQSDLFVAYHRCTFCREQTIAIRVECTPPDDATEIFRWFCSTGCVAKYETNQPRPDRNSNRPSLSVQLADRGR